MSLLCPVSPHKTPSSKDAKGWIYTQPNSGAIFRSHGLDVLKGFVESHRFAMAGKDMEMDLSHGWDLRWLNDVCDQNPSAPSMENPQDPAFEPPHVAQGRALWKELHEKAETDFDPHELRSWFDRWIDRVPDYAGCRCRSNAIQILNSMPPDFSKEGFKVYCVRLHNEISKRLGKKQWPYSD